MKHYPIAISCDWFALSCSCEGGFIPEKKDEAVADTLSAARFTFDDSPEHHPYYESSCLAREGRAPIAHLFFRCKRSEHRFSCQVKVDNSRLYYARWGESLMALIRALRWRVMFVNRIDICADFNYFANGRLPLQFCRDYLAEPTKGRPSFIRHSSNKLRAQVTRGLHSLNYETLSWGTRDSAVQVNLYNKSLELEEKSDKPWIRQRWIEAGLEHGDLSGKKMSVWRCEFSINPSALMVRDKSGNPLGSLNLNHVCSPAALIETWNVLHPRYFTFHFLTKEDSARQDVRVRDLPLVTLFERDDCVKYRVSGVQYYRKSNRTDRLLVRRLEEQIDEDGLSAGEKASLRQVVEMLRERFFIHGREASRENLANDVLDEYLMSCFADVLPHDSSAPISQQREWRRRASLWSRMLRGAHDPDIERFFDALRQLEELSGTDAFEQCLKYANYVAGGAMPDEVISDYVDCDVIESSL